MSEIKVRTRFRGATNTMGERVVATGSLADADVRVTMPWRYEMSAEQNHQTAALVIARDYSTETLGENPLGGWFIRSVEVDRSPANGYVFTFTVGE